METLPPATLSPELTARVQAITRSAYAHWAGNCTQEQKDKALADQEKFKTDPEHNAAKMAKFNDTWNSADANQDGLLDLAEFKVYMAATREHMANMGTFAGERPGGDEETYAVCNESNPDREGIALAEYMGVMGIMAVEMAKIKAEEGQ